MRLPVSTAAFSLLTAAFLWPVEDAISGAGLHLVLAWLLIGALTALQSWQAAGRDSEFRPASCGLMDLGVLLIAVGHVISTAAVWRAGGDVRSALNLTFEWVGLLVAWRLFRGLLQNRQVAAQAVSLLIAVAVGLSAFGIWQFHVGNRIKSAEYVAMRAELDDALRQPSIAASARAAAIIAEFQAQEIPLDGAGRVLLENRLLSSTEPIATFSLTNTLAGVLAAALLLVAGQFTWMTIPRGRESIVVWLVAAVQVSLIGYCLILTKSRSGWAGALAGLTVLAVLRSQTGSLLKILRWGMLGIAGSVLAFGVAAMTGAIDKEVVLESPRSLQFRLMYWTGSIQMLKEHPLAGAGPGNFRQLYLQHRVDEASEEIRDPHNMLLDAWSSAGLMGLAGLLLLVTALFRQLFRSDRQVEHPSAATTFSRRSRKVVASGLLLGFAWNAVWDWFQGYSISSADGGRLLLLAGVLPFLPWVRWSPGAVDASTGRAAAVAIMVHLLASGGFEMPAVMLLLLVCLALGSSPGNHPSPARSAFAATLPQPAVAAAEQPAPQQQVPGLSDQSAWPSWIGLPVAMVMLGGVIVVLKWGLQPVLEAERYVLIGDDALNRQRMPQAAAENYRRAAESDPPNVTPRQRLAELETYKLEELRNHVQNSSLTDDPQQIDNDHSIGDAAFAGDQMDSALRATELLIAADKRNCNGYRWRARCLAAGSVVLKNPDLMEQAIADHQTVVTLYPSSVQDWAQLAVLDYESHDHQATELSRSAARRALALASVNRNWGHQEQFLAADQTTLLEKIAAE